MRLRWSSCYCWHRHVRRLRKVQSLHLDTRTLVQFDVVASIGVLVSENTFVTNLLVMILLSIDCPVVLPKHPVHAFNPLLVSCYSFEMRNRTQTAHLSCHHTRTHRCLVSNGLVESRRLLPNPIDGHLQNCVTGSVIATFSLSRTYPLALVVQTVFLRTLNACLRPIPTIIPLFNLTSCQDFQRTLLHSFLCSAWGVQLQYMG
jgi:hypothetical protein